MSTTSVELLVHGYIRQKIESNKSWNLTIPDPIKVICEKYHGLFVFTESNILNVAQQLDLWRLLSQKIKFQQTTLLYNGKRDGFTRAGFFKNNRNKSPTVIIIHSNYGNIFGVFTTFHWNWSGKGKHMANDKHAFMWLLKSRKGDDIKPQIFWTNYFKEVDECGWRGDIICKFGNVAVTLIEPCNIRRNNIICNDISYGIEDATVLCGGNQPSELYQYPGAYSFGCIDIELFQINEPWKFVPINN